MSFYASTTGLTALSFALTGFFVFSRDTKNILFKRCFVFSMAVASWAVGYFLTLLELPYYSLNLYASRLSHCVGALIPITYLHFVWKILERKHSHYFFVASYVISSVLAFLCLTPLVVRELLPKMGFMFYPEAGVLYPVYSLLFIVYPGLAQILVAKKISVVQGNERVRLIYFFAALALAFVGGISLFLLIFNIPFPPHFSALIILYPPTMAYIILVHKFLEIEVVVKKTLVFAGLFVMVMSVVSGVTTLTQDVLGKYFSISPTVGTLISVVIAVFLYEPAKNFLIHATDKYLFQKKLDFKLVLNRLSNDIITILDIEKAGSTILSTLKTTLRLESGLIFIKDENEDDYKTLESFGVEKSPRRLVKDNLLLQYLFETKNMINLEDPEQRKNLPVEVLKILDACKAAITIPLFVGSDLIGVLMLGKKQSDQEFSQDEIGYFPTIAGQVAIALSNARLYDLLKKSQIDFAQQAKMAAIGTLSAGISHEIKNPLNHIKVGISMLRMNKKHGVLDQMERYKMEEEVFRTLEILDENVTRANEVIERLSSFAKKPKELKIEPVDLTAAVGQALSFVEKEYEHHQIEIEKNFPEHMPLVNADLHTLEDVFLNLLVNARHAILDHGKVTISATTHEGVLDLTIKDTGKGISKENLAKIWDPFFTTKDVSRNPDKSAVKGSGLGLFIVREFIQRFGGNITVESTLGRGTTFHVVFPEAVWAK